MSILATPMSAPEPRSETARQISLIYAGLLVVMAVTQLYSFEAFVELLQGISVVSGSVGAYLLAPIIVLSEVFALPFLLRMTLSTPFRYFSMILAGFVAVFWLIVSVRVMVANLSVETVGFLGALVNLTPGWWAVFMSLALVNMALWSAWGLWPGKSTSK